MIWYLLRRVIGLLFQKDHEKRAIATVKEHSGMSEMFRIKLQKYSPGYRIEVHDEDARIKFFEQHYEDAFLDKYYRIHKECHKMGFFKYAYLHRKGGAFIGINTNISGSLNELFPNKERCYVVEKSSCCLDKGAIYTPPNNPLIYMIMMDILHDKENELDSCSSDSIERSSYKIMNINTEKGLKIGLNRTVIGPSIVLYYEFPSEDTFMNKQLRMSKIFDHEEKPVINLHYRTTESDYELSFDSSEVAKKSIQSFSEYGQDEWVLKHTGYKRGGFYIDIGTTNGKEGSNTYLLDTRFQWKGICLGSKMSNMSERSAKQHQGHIRTMHCPKREHSTRIDTILDQFEVPVFVDYLCVNTTHEMSIICGIDFKTYMFEVISVKHNYVDSYRYNLHGFLNKKGYVLKTKLGDNDIFLHNSRRAL